MAINDDLTPLLKALSDPKRRQIISLLQEKPRTTGDLCSFFDVSRFAVMKHLNVLEESGLVKVRREGRQRWNFVDDDLLQQVQTLEFEGNDGDSAHTARENGSGADNSANSLELSVELSVTLNAPPAVVFRALTTDINIWWTRRAADSQGVYLEPEVNGRFYEAFGQTGHGSLLGTVTYIKANEEIHLMGPMGIVDGASFNLVRLTLTTEDDGTRLHLFQQILGKGDTELIQRYRQRWHTLLAQHLKEFVEDGVHYQSTPEQRHL